MAAIELNLELNGKFKKTVENAMKTDDVNLSPEIIKFIFNQATKILKKCIDPNLKYSSQENNSNTGLVIGKVQSGKTSIFLALLALAFDNNYNLAIVIGGITKLLLEQSSDRIEKAFKILTGTKELIILKSTIDNALNANEIKDFIENGKKVIIVCLKSPQENNERHLTSVKKIFDEPFLTNQPTLIIDDEGDQASLNSKQNIKNEDKERVRSATNKVFVEMRKKIKVHSFISITATPQANMLIQQLDELSPDFCELITPGIDYCGISIFHNENKNPYLKIIPLEDYENSIFDDGNNLTDSFKEALASFFVGNAIRRSRGDFGNHSLLVHSSHKVENHSKVASAITQLINLWKIKVKNKDDLTYENSLRPKLEKAYMDFWNSGIKINKNFFELESEINKCIAETSAALIVNSKDNGLEIADNYKTRIFVGGNIMGRGLTIDGLAVSYMTRSAKTGADNVDTLEQRARWFGYKKNYLDVCRIWLTEELKNKFISIKDSEEDIWNKIANYEGDIKNMPRFIRLDQDFYTQKLNITRKSVANTQYLNFGNNWIHQKKYVFKISHVKWNTRLIKSFLENKDYDLVDYGTINRHKIYRNLYWEEFYKEIIKNFCFQENETLPARLPTPTFRDSTKWKCDLVIMRHERGQKREIKDDFSMEIFRGSHIQSGGNDGDSYLPYKESPGRIQIQIHYIQANNKDWNVYSPTLSIFWPSEKPYKFSGVGRAQDHY